MTFGITSSIGGRRFGVVLLPLLLLALAGCQQQATGAVPEATPSPAAQPIVSGVWSSR